VEKKKTSKDTAGKNLAQTLLKAKGGEKRAVRVKNTTYSEEKEERGKKKIRRGAGAEMVLTQLGKGIPDI